MSCPIEVYVHLDEPWRLNTQYSEATYKVKNSGKLDDNRMQVHVSRYMLCDYVSQDMYIIINKCD